MKIASELGGMTADELSERLTIGEFYEWITEFKTRADEERRAYQEARR